MGLSSSQARLLNLTSRMHQIEYKAAKLEAEKLQMANESRRVNETYLMALTAHTIGAKVLTTDGAIGSTALTVGKMFEPGALPEQYCVKTTDGNKIIVPETMYSAYNKTEDLGAFLEELGLVTSFTRTYHEHNDEYDRTIERFNNDHANWERRKAEYEITHPQWEAREPKQEDFIINNTKLGDTFQSASINCYTNAASGSDINCYKHVLSSIIDYEVGKGYDPNASWRVNQSWYSNANNCTYDTSINTKVKVTSNSGSYISQNAQSCADLSEISKKLNQTNYGKPLYTANTEGETYPASLDTASDFEKLLSKWDTRTKTGKGLKQWAIDIFAAINLYSSEPDASVKLQMKERLKESIVEFQTTMNETNVVNTEEFDKAVKQWKSEEPEHYGDEPQLDDYLNGVPEFFVRTESEITFTDKSLAEYYINIWSQMNQMENVPQITSEDKFDDALGEYVTVYSVEAEPKNDTSVGKNPGGTYDEHDNFIVVQDELLNDPSWLSKLVDDNFVMIQYFDNKKKNFFDTSVAVNVNLEEVDDKTMLRKAEAQYEADMLKIDRKDRKYDYDLAALDAERNAIKQEMDTLKTVAKENVDRTFRLFS